MPQDPLEALLRAAPLNDRQRAGIWDMYEMSRNPDDLAGRLKSMEIPQDLKAALWDLKSQADAPPESLPTGGVSGSWEPATWSDKLGMNQGTDSMLQGFARGASGAGVDMVQGAIARLRNMTAKGGDPALRQMLGAVPVEQQQDVATAPETFAGAVGGVVPDVALMAAPVGGAVKAGINAIPRVARAGEKFQEVMGAAKNIPIDVKEVGDVALRINQLAERGGSMPMAVRKILNRMTDPNKAPMVYEEARDFASNISRLSANEYGRLTPAVAREVANLRVVLNKANADAAKLAGKGEEYASAMKEYAQAMRLREAVEKATKVAKKSVLYASAAGVGYWLTRQVRSALGGE